MMACEYCSPKIVSKMIGIHNNVNEVSAFGVAAFSVAFTKKSFQKLNIFRRGEYLYFDENFCNQREIKFYIDTVNPSYIDDDPYYFLNEYAEVTQHFVEKFDKDHCHIEQSRVVMKVFEFHNSFYAEQMRRNAKHNPWIYEDHEDDHYYIYHKHKNGFGF